MNQRGAQGAFARHARLGHPRLCLRHAVCSRIHLRPKGGARGRVLWAEIGGRVACDRGLREGVHSAAPLSRLQWRVAGRAAPRYSVSSLVAAQPGQKQVYYTKRERACPTVTTVTPRRRTAAKLAPRRIQEVRKSGTRIYVSKKESGTWIYVSGMAEALAFPATPSQTWTYPHFVSFCPCFCLCVLACAPSRPWYLDGLLHL